jgi:lysozyme
MPELEVLQAADLPSDLQEAADVGPAGGAWDDSTPSEGYPFASSMRPDVEPGLSEAHRAADLTPVEADEATRASLAVTKADQAGLNLIAAFEGFLPHVEDDPLVGVPTVGFGTTSAVVYPLPRTVTRAQAFALLAKDLNEHVEPAIRAMGVPLNQHQFDACCSLGYNLGPGCFGSDWTIGAKLRARDWAGAAAVWDEYDTAGGRFVQGLLNRRQEERKLFLEPMPPAPDPHHLLWFQNKTWLISGKRVPERATVARWYELVGDKKKNAGELKKLQADVVLLRKRAWAVAHQVKPPRWGVDHLGGRWQILNDLAQVKL